MQVGLDQVINNDCEGLRQTQDLQRGECVELYESVQN